jgi:amino acid transporter
MAIVRNRDILDRIMSSLRRGLRLPDLVFMGLILIQPTAPMPLYGVVSNTARGHVVSAILVAMVGMLCTAYSYGRMSQVYPVAGSAYSYVGHALHPALGYLTGWSMLMDYLLNPVICTIWCAKAAANILPGVPFAAWALFFALLFTLLNLRGIQATAQLNRMLAIAMGLVILWMLYASARHVLALPALPAGFFTLPFYDPARFNWGSFSTGTSLAVLTYIGFDALSTLSEEVHNPRKTILWGTVITCLLIGILSALEVYAAQLVWPVSETFPDADTAYVHVAGRAGGPWLFHAVNFTLLIATVGSGSGALMAGARLLFGMGRDESLPRSFFGYIHPATQVPSRNVMLIGVLALAGAFAMSYQLGAELLNFGAFIGFMGVNLAALRHYGFHPAPALGFAICLFLWWNLSPLAKGVGTAWLAIGFALGWWKTQGFRKPLARFDSVD